MARYRTTGDLDDAILTDGDRGFVGMDMRRQGNQLEAGLVRLSQNGRMDGYWQGRKGAELIGGALTLETEPLRIPFWLVDEVGGFDGGVDLMTVSGATNPSLANAVYSDYGDYGGRTVYVTSGSSYAIFWDTGTSQYFLCAANFVLPAADDEYPEFYPGITYFRTNNSPVTPDAGVWITVGSGTGVVSVAQSTSELTAYRSIFTGETVYITAYAHPFLNRTGTAWVKLSGFDNVGKAVDINGMREVVVVNKDILSFTIDGISAASEVYAGPGNLISELSDTAVSTILGSCVFSDPSSDDEESIVLATNSVAKLVSLRSPYTVTDLRYPLTESLTNPVEMVQAFDRVILFRDGARAWEWVPQGRPVIAAALAANVVTVTCRDHGLKVGDVVTLSDIGYATTNPNGSRTVASVTSADVFTFALTAANETYTANTGKMVADFFTLSPAGVFTQPETFPMTAADIIVADGLVTADLTTAALTNSTIKAGDFVTVYQSDAAELSGMAGNTYQVVSATTAAITFYAPVGDYNTAATDAFVFGGRFSIGAGFMNMPGAPWGTYFQRRMWVPFWYSPAGTYTTPIYTDKVQHDQIAASDILDPWTYDQVESQFRITAGIADHLVGMQPFYEDALMVLNRNSLHLVVGTQGSLSDTVVKELTREVGCLARKSIVSQGNSVFFLSDNGVYGVGFIEGYNLRGIEEPLSKPIQPLIDRVNKTLASKSVGVYFNNRYYLALPLDSQAGAGDADGNNSVLIFNMLNKGWESLDTFGEGNFNILNFHIARAEERNDLYAINEFGGIHKMESSNLPVDSLSFDVLGGSSDYSVDSMLQTRSYDFGDQDRKRFTAAQVQCQSDNAASDVVFSFSAEDPDSGSESIGSIVDMIGSELEPNDTANLRMRLGGLRGFMGTLTISANLAGSAPIGRLKVQSVAVDATMTNRQTLSQH